MTLPFAGYFCPVGTGALNASLACASPAQYCPRGSSSPTATPNGSYAVAVALSTPRVFSAAVECEAGAWCDGGVRQPCPAGRYGNATRETRPRCTGDCLAGYFCAEGSTRPHQETCGAAEVFCVQVCGAACACAVRGRWSSMLTVVSVCVSTRALRCVSPWQRASTQRQRTCRRSSVHRRRSALGDPSVLEVRGAPCTLPSLCLFAALDVVHVAPLTVCRCVPVRVCRIPKRVSWRHVWRHAPLDDVDVLGSVRRRLLLPATVH